MKKREIKKYVSKCDKKFRIRYYIILGITIIAFTTALIIQHRKYVQLRAEVWNKVEEIMNIKHFEKW